MLKGKINPVNLLKVKLNLKEEEPDWEQGGTAAEDGEVRMEEQASDQEGEEKEEEQYVVEKILEMQKCGNGVLLFKVKWKGFSNNECTWEPLENLADHTGTCVHLERFEEKIRNNQKMSEEIKRNNGELKLEKDENNSEQNNFMESDHDISDSEFIQDVKPKKATSSSAKRKKKVDGYSEQDHDFEHDKLKKKRITKIQKRKDSDDSDDEFDGDDKMEKKRIQKTRAQLESEGFQYEPEETFTCKFCSQICKSLTALRVHQKKHCTENSLHRFQCHICDVVVDSLDDIKKHTSSEHEEKDDNEILQSCKFCNIEFKNVQMKVAIKLRTNKVISQRHQRKCLSQIMKNLKCSQCPVEAPSKEMLLEHLKSCHNVTPPPWPCLKPDCEQVCVNQDARRSHMFKQHDIRLKDARYKRVMNFTCSFCLIPNNFLTEAECKEHEEQWHKFDCSEDGCDFTCQSEQMLADHGVKIHNMKIDVEAKPPPDKSVCCDQCGKRFANAHNLKDHLELHEEKEVMCDKCDKVFKRTLNLKMHIRLMHRDTTYECQYCGKVCKNTRSLWGHIKQYHEEKKWHCELCGKAFVAKVKMEEHIVSVHTKTTPWSCKYGCGRAYNDRSNKRAHEKSVHEGNPRRPKVDGGLSINHTTLSQ